MDDDALPRGYMRDNRIPGDRMAAAREAHDRAERALDRGVLPVAPSRGRVDRHPASHQLLRDDDVDLVSERDVMQEVIEVQVMGLHDDAVDVRLRYVLDPDAPQRVHEEAAPEHNSGGVIDALQVLPDLGAGAGRYDKGEPRGARNRAAPRDDLDRLPGHQGPRERIWHLVDPRSHAVVAEVGVHGIGEVDRRCAVRQREYLPLRGEHVDLVREEVGLDVLDELEGVSDALLQL